MDAPLIESGEERTSSVVKQHAASGSSSKKCYFLSLALNVVFFVSTVVLACLYLSKSDHQTHAANSAAPLRLTSATLDQRTTPTGFAPGIRQSELCEAGRTVFHVSRRYILLPPHI